MVVISQRGGQLELVLRDSPVSVGPPIEAKLHGRTNETRPHIGHCHTLCAQDSFWSSASTANDKSALKGEGGMRRRTLT